MGIDPGAVVSDLSGSLARWIDAHRRDESNDDENDAAVDAVAITAVAVLDRAEPALVSCRVAISRPRGDELHHAVLAVGPMAPAVVDVADVVGVLGASGGEAVVWDAMADPASIVRLVAHIAPGLGGRTARRLRRSRGHTSVVVDETWEACFFHRVVAGRHPEIAFATAIGGRAPVDGPVTVWTERGCDLAVVRSGSVGARSAGDMCRSSLRGLVAEPHRLQQAIHDVVEDMRAVGGALGDLHVTSAAECGAEPLSGPGLADALTSGLDDRLRPGVTRDRVAGAYARIADARDLGSAIAVHGRPHLDALRDGPGGWSFASLGRCDLDGEPSRRSPLADVAVMVGDIAERAAAARTGDEDVDVVVTAWEEALADALVAGYTATGGIGALLPPDGPACDALMRVFELDARVHGVRDTVASVDLRRLEPSAIDRLVPSVGDEVGDRDPGLARLR